MFFSFSAANNVSMAHQWPNSELKSSTSSVNATGSHFVRDATQSRPQFKADMHPAASQGPGKITYMFSCFSLLVTFAMYL